MKYTSIFALTLFAAASAVAANNISWVASTGLDTNNCTRTAPCHSFQTAHDNTSTGGIIKAVDAANYGMVNVSQNITIDGNGVGAEIEVAGTGTGIAISSGTVTIRDLTIHCLLNGDGIDTFNTETHIENVMILGRPFQGVYAANPLGTGAPVVTAKNLTVIGATNSGIFIDQGSSAVIRDSVVHSYGGDGIHVRSNGYTSVALIERSDLSFNSTGLVAENASGGGATARISDCVITGNNTGISTLNGGQIISFRTNMLAGNIVTDGATPFSISLK
jgi:hypothetical protein